MEVFESMYYKLFNKMTDITKEIQEIQQLTEEMFISQAENKDKQDNNCTDK